MKYCNLHGVNASGIVMGCMRIADKPLRQTEEVIVEALRAGVNMFDYVYVKIAKVGDGYYLYGYSRVSSLPTE